MTETYDNALSYSSQWLEIIKQENFPEEAQAKWIIDESKNNFAEHFNRNWLEYRKSVTEAGDWASVEWSGKDSTFTDVLGRKYIDWLGVYGMMDLGWCHSEVVEAVIAQVRRSPMPSQELIDPLRGVLAKLMAEITPGDISTINMDGTGLEKITTHPDFDSFPMWSPDGRKLVWTSNRNQAKVGETNLFIADWVD